MPGAKMSPRSRGNGEAGLPGSLAAYLQSVVRETARMSFPSRMQRVLKKDTKKAVENHFVRRFPVADLWKHPHKVKRDFEAWHRKRINALAGVLRKGKYV